MKLLRHGRPGQEQPGLLDAAGQIRDLSHVVTDIAGETLTAAGLDELASLDPAKLPVVHGDVRLGAWSVASASSSASA